MKILDFGLAKLSGQSMLTKTGETVGNACLYVTRTVKRGEVDSHGQTFSHSVLCFMKCLQESFPSKEITISALMYSIVNDEPEPLEKHIH